MIEPKKYNSPSLFDLSERLGCTEQQLRDGHPVAIQLLASYDATWRLAEWMLLSPLLVNRKALGLLFVEEGEYSNEKEKGNVAVAFTSNLGHKCRRGSFKLGDWQVAFFANILWSHRGV